MRASYQRHGGPEVLEVAGAAGPAGRCRARCGSRSRRRGSTSPTRWRGSASTRTRRSRPASLGYEVAGEVESVGEGVESVKAGRPGDGRDPLRRPAPSWSPSPAEQVLPLPTRLSFEQGAAFPVNYATAYAALVIMGGLREGERVLIHAAAGGVGISATQIARRARRGDLRHRLGVQARRDPRAGRRPPDRLPHPGLRGGGAADHRRRGDRRRLRRASARRSFRKDYRLLRPGGRLIMYGLARGSRAARAAEHPGGRCRSLAADAAGDDALVEEPAIMNENKGVFGLNMLHWWDREGDLDRVIEPLADDLDDGRPRAGRRRGVPVRARRRRPPLHRRAAEHRQGRARARDGRCRRGRRSAACVRRRTSSTPASARLPLLLSPSWSPSASSAPAPT